MAAPAPAVCKHYLQGSCKWGGQCRFLHPPRDGGGIGVNPFAPRGAGGGPAWGPAPAPLPGLFAAQTPARGAGVWGPALGVWGGAPAPAGQGVWGAPGPAPPPSGLFSPTRAPVPAPVPVPATAPQGIWAAPTAGRLSPPHPVPVPVPAPALPLAPTLPTAAGPQGIWGQQWKPALPGPGPAPAPVLVPGMAPGRPPPAPPSDVTETQLDTLTAAELHGFRSTEFTWLAVPEVPPPASLCEG
jgi:hypothetical protein